MLIVLFFSELRLLLRSNRPNRSDSGFVDKFFPVAVPADAGACKFSLSNSNFERYLKLRVLNLSGSHGVSKAGNPVQPPAQLSGSVGTGGQPGDTGQPYRYGDEVDLEVDWQKLISDFP